LLIFTALDNAAGERQRVEPSALVYLWIDIDGGSAHFDAVGFVTLTTNEKSCHK